MAEYEPPEPKRDFKGKDQPKDSTSAKDSAPNSENLNQNNTHHLTTNQIDP